MYSICWYLKASEERYIYGEKTQADGIVDKALSLVLIPDQDEIPESGVLLKWHFFASNTEMIYLQVWRRSADEHDDKSFVLVGQTEYTHSIPNATHEVILSHSTGIQVKRGDLIGFFAPQRGTIPYVQVTCLTSRSFPVVRYQPVSSPLMANNTYTIGRVTPRCREYAFQAHIERGTHLKL